MKKKNKKALLLSLVLILGIFLPYSIIRIDGGFALEKNILIAQDSPESSDTNENAINDEEAEEKSDSEKEKTENKPSAKEKASDGEKKESPKLYNYSKQNGEETSMGWRYFQFFLIIGLLLAGFYIFFRFVTKKTGIANIGAEAVNVLTVVPVGPNKYIQIVDIAGQIFVLGVTDSNISKITEITDKDNKDRIKLLSSKSTPMKNANFQKYFNDSISFITSLINKTPINKTTSTQKPNRSEQQFNPDDSANKNIRDNEYLDEYIDTDKMEYLKRQKNRLKKLNGFNDED